MANISVIYERRCTSILSYYGTNFYFGVLYPVVRTLSRLLGEPSFATTFQSVYFIFFAAKISYI
jgi:hypothetical protein